MNNSYITIIKEKRTALSRKRIPLNQNGCTANFRIGVPFEQNLHTGGAYMKKAKNTTLDERLKIVTDCLANDKNYGAMALKYDCSYQQVRNWVIRYEKMGQAGLEDRRGRRIASLPSRTPEEELRDKIAELEKRNLDLQMENDLLKKVRELERRGRYL